MPAKRWTIHTRPQRPRRAFIEEQSSALVHAPSKANTPAIYHCVNRVVDKRFIFGPRERDKFIELMRMYETFSGNRILAYCVMSNHFHLMLEVTPMPEKGLCDEELLNRLAAIYDEATVASVQHELSDARNSVAEGRNAEGRIAEIHARYTYRMHDLSEFMKSLVQRFTQWHNRRNQRKGNLWEDAFRSTVVEPGIAARMVATYIDLNPVRAGIVNDPGDYPWCSHGEAAGGSKHHKKPTPANLRARGGLVRAFFAHEGAHPDPKRWKECQKIQRPWIDQAIQKLQSRRQGQPTSPCEDHSPGSALAVRIRHFSEGIAIGGRDFLDEFFHENRERFGKHRSSGPRPIRGSAASMTKNAGICSIRDLQKEVGS